MDPCMGAPADTAASAYRPQSYAEDRDGEREGKDK